MLLDIVIMAGIVGFLIFLLAFRAKYNPEGNAGFFDVQNTAAMRGFWCLIVVLVHIPSQYQNKIQDMIGSFAYIGVTFFFMTSAYGLSLAQMKKPESIKKFWRNRLPKLLIPNWASNTLFALIFLLAWGTAVNVSTFLFIGGWVRWLMGCYLIFWLSRRFPWWNKYGNWIAGILIVAVSVAFYCLKHFEIVTTTIWCTEIFGFLWGLLMAGQYEKIKNFFTKKWLLKVVISCLLALVLGVMYLLFKPVVFWGDYLLKIVLGAAILSFILILNSKIRIGNKIVGFLGDISFEVYLIHSFVFKLVARILPNVGSGVFIAASIAGTVFFSWIIHQACKILLKQLYKIIPQ